MLDKVEVGKIYRNKKNKCLYTVLLISRYTEEPMEMELVVSYEALYKSDYPYFTRPYNLFLEKFEEVEIEETLI